MKNFFKSPVTILSLLLMFIMTFFLYNSSTNLYVSQKDVDTIRTPASTTKSRDSSKSYSLEDGIKAFATAASETIVAPFKIEDIIKSKNDFDIFYQDMIELQSKANDLYLAFLSKDVSKEMLEQGIAILTSVLPNLSAYSKKIDDANKNATVSPLLTDAKQAIEDSTAKIIKVTEDGEKKSEELNKKEKTISCSKDGNCDQATQIAQLKEEVIELKKITEKLLQANDDSKDKKEETESAFDFEKLMKAYKNMNTLTIPNNDQYYASQFAYFLNYFSSQHNSQNSKYANQNEIFLYPQYQQMLNPYASYPFNVGFSSYGLGLGYGLNSDYYGQNSIYSQGVNLYRIPANNSSSQIFETSYHRGVIDSPYSASLGG